MYICIGNYIDAIHILTYQLTSSRGDYVKIVCAPARRLPENHSCIVFSGQLPSCDFSDTDHLSFRASELTQVRCIIHDIGRKRQGGHTYCPASIHRGKSFGTKSHRFRKRETFVPCVSRFADARCSENGATEISRIILEALYELRRALIAQPRILIRGNWRVYGTLCVD